MDERLKANRDNWNSRVNVHVQSKFYNVAGFLAGGNSLLPLEVAEVGPVNGLRVLHLMCHFGLDTLSLARMGAHVTGVDFSDRAIEQARKLAAEAGLEAQFHCADVYEARSLDIGTFDLVFMNFGVLCWLPDVHELMRTVSAHLKPGGEVLPL